jgi:hypothetical protein
MADRYAPRPEHKFSFGLWTVGNRGREPFGDAVRDALPPVDAVALLAEVGAWGVNLHDNDLVPVDASPADRDRIVTDFKAACSRHGIVVPMATDYLTPLSTTTPLLQPINGDYASGIGPWEIDLAKLFLIPGPGVYRFRYAYVPPQERQAKEYGESSPLKFWNGRGYSDNFEFQVSEPTSNRPR